MKSFPPVACLAALILSFPFSPVAAAAGTTKHALAVRNLRRDLKTIPAHSQPTDAQKQALSADLAGLFRDSDLPPAVTLDYAAGILAEIAARGTLQDADIQSIALKLSDILNGSAYLSKRQVAALKVIFQRASVEQGTVRRLTDSLRALAGSFQADYDSNYLTVPLGGFAGDTKGYRHATGYASLNRFQTPASANGANFTVGMTLNVSLSRVPTGRYAVSVTTTDGRSADLGTFKVRQGGGVFSAFSLDSMEPADTPDDPTADDDGGMDDPSPIDDGGDTDPSLDPSVIYQTAAPGSSIALPPGAGYHYGMVIFGNVPFAQPLPAGLALEDVATVTVTDQQGAQQWTGSLVTPAKSTLSRSAHLHLTAGALAPAATGSVGFGDESGGAFRLRTFLLNATGLPSSTTLTFSIDGAAVETVTTGPTGRLFVKSTTAVFPQPPKRTEIVNPFPETVDLFAAKSFAVSDAHGNVLLSGALQD